MTLSLKSKLLGAALAAVMPFAAYAGTELKFAGSLEFSDEGVLFVGDNHAGAIVALDLAGGTSPEKVMPVFIGDIDKQIADTIGVGPNAIEINDMAVHPVTHDIYISVMRIGGNASRAALVKVDQAGEISLVDLESVESNSQSLAHYPDQDLKFRPRGLMGSRRWRAILRRVTFRSLAGDHGHGLPQRRIVRLRRGI